jgi:predicted ester cyclase
MTRDEVVQFFETHQEHWRNRDAAALAADHALDGTVISPMFGDLHGRGEIETAYRKLFTTFPDWVFQGDDLVVDGDRVAQHFISTATHIGEFMGLSGSGRHGKIEGARLYTMKGGKIQNEQRLYDFSALLIQIGVLRSKPSF